MDSPDLSLSLFSLHLPGCCPVARFGKASPYLPLNAGLVLCQNHLACRGRASETNRTPWQALPWGKPRSQVRPALHPVAAISLSVALWKESAVVPTPSVPQPRTGRVGQVFRRSPRVVDVQSTVQSCRGFGIFTATSEQTISLVLNCFAPESRTPSKGSAAFAFLNASRAKTHCHHSPTAEQPVGLFSPATSHLSLLSIDLRTKRIFAIVSESTKQP